MIKQSSIGMMRIDWYPLVISPPARWGLLDFMSVACSSPPLLSSSPLLLLLLNRDPRRTVFSVGPQPRPSTPSVPCRTSTTTIPAQCSLPDLNHDHPRPVFPAGPQLGGDGRGWGPAGNTASIHAKCSLPDLTGRGWSWLRSGREHCGSRVAVGRGRRGRRGRQGRQGWRGRRQEEARGGRRRQEEATDIKSNNPHLAGGEIHPIHFNVQKNTLFILW